MATLPTTDAVPTVPANIPVANLLRVVLQRVIEGEELDGDSRRVLSTLINLAMEIAPAAPAQLPEQRRGVLYLEPIEPKPQPAPKFGQVGEGYYMLDGMYVKVQQNQAGNRTYGKVWLPGDQAWSYEAARDERVMTRLKPSHKLSAEDAHKFGDLYGRCIFCSAQLNDERSIAAGYGEVCASNHGLPWG